MTTTPPWVSPIASSLFRSLLAHARGGVEARLGEGGTQFGLLTVEEHIGIAFIAQASPAVVILPGDIEGVDAARPYVVGLRPDFDDTDGAPPYAAIDLEQVALDREWAAEVHTVLTERVAQALEVERRARVREVTQKHVEEDARLRVDGRRPARVGPFEVVLEARESISFIGAYNSRPTVHRLAVRSLDGVAHESVSVRVELVSLGVALASPWGREVASIGPKGLTWNRGDFADLRFDHGLFSQITERQHAELVVTIEQGGLLLGSLRRGVEVLAADSWASDQDSPMGSYAVDLAALVQPHEPMFQPLLARASDALRARTGNGGLSAYQFGPTHDDEMVRALFEAAQAAGITYADPPNSWDMGMRGGQRVRRPGQVLSEHVGTCLDTSVLLASLMAAVGLQPVLFLVPGHAFVGYWREDGWQHHELTWQLADGLNWIDGGRLVVIESTVLTDREAAYASALSAGKDKVAEHAYVDRPEMQGKTSAVDVAAAHRTGTVPLPLRTITADGAVQLVEFKPQELDIQLLDKALAAARSTSTGLQGEQVPVRVKRWLDQLLDLSLRNPLLNYRFSDRSSVSLAVPDGFLGRLEDLLQSGVKVELVPNQLVDRATGRPVPLIGARRTMTDRDATAVKEATDGFIGRRAVLTTLTPDTFATRMRRMVSAARTAIDETGSNQLYLALGMVVWVPDGKREPVSAPLILVPVNVVGQNRNREFRLEIDTTSQVTPNFSLAEKLRVDAKIVLPKLVAPDLDDAGIDVDGLVAYVRKAFMDGGLRDFRVDESATLGFFDFSTYRLWKDLKDNWSQFSANSALVRHLVETPSAEFDDGIVLDADANIDDFAASLPVLADGSQARAVHHAMQGKTFVLQGPPGTGKSQTITNLLARALQSGKRVLFVAEKPDALAVVRDRLNKVGLGAFGLNLHDKGMKPADVRKQLAAALGAGALADTTGFDAATRDIARSQAALQRYPERLHAKGSLGESVYSARDKLLALTVESELPVPASFVASTTPDVVAHVRTVLADAREAAANAGSARANPWSFARAGSAAFASDRRAEFTAWVAAARTALDRIQALPASAAYLASIESLAEIVQAAPLARRSIELAVVDANAGAAATQARRHVLTTIELFAADRLFPGAAPQLMHAPVAELRAGADAALTSFLIGRKKKVIAAADRAAQFLAPGHVLTGEGLLPAIAEIEQVQTRARQYVDYVRSIPGLFVAPDVNMLVAEHRAAIIEQVRRIDEDVALLAHDGSAARARLRDLVSAGAAFAGAVGALGEAFGATTRALGVTTESLGLWLDERDAEKALIETVDGWHRDATTADFRQLRRWLALRDLLAQLEAAGLSAAAAHIAAGAVPAAEIDLAFERGFLTQVLRHQLDEQGLDAFDGAAHDGAIRTYGRAADALRELSPGILGADMIASRGFDGAVTVGAVGELKRELAKQRQFKPIRRLLKEHALVILRATPLVLAIPDALVRFMDAELEPFDLVVFDEASQIKTAHAIGVLGRGRAAVVVGDDKQMPPTSVAQIGAAAEEESPDDGAPVTASILDECKLANVSEIKLTWHYRSEDESLIAFSNHQYYEGKLATLPGPQVHPAGKGLTFVPVDGHFQRAGQANAGTNREEALAIVAEIVRRLTDPRDRHHSIGVVTFNRPQQRLIQELLQQREDATVVGALNDGPHGEAVKVWNLETVQGSERDVMLFSTAFSKDAQGRLSRNFGPLNNEGGERRLNVAVTRARRQTMVFCSFQPEDLKADGLATGLQHLERYLRIARDGFESDGTLASQKPGAPDRHRDEIAQVLRERGLRVQTNVGLSEFKVDIAVSEVAPEGSWSVGVLTDGVAWKSRNTVGDRDSLPLSLLGERMGWSAVVRVWTPDWLRNAGDVADTIVAKVREVEGGAAMAGRTADEGTSGASARPDDLLASDGRAEYRTAASTPMAAPSVAREPHADVPVWRSWNAPGDGPEFVLEQLWDEGTREYLRRLVTEMIAVEGPVLADRAAKALARMHGLKQVRGARVAAITDVLAPGFSVSADGFYFTRGTDLDGYAGWMRVRDEGRSAAEISLIEISNAMRDIAALGFGASPGELIVSAAAMFGYQRVTASVRERMESAITEGFRRGVLTDQGGYVRAEQRLTLK